MDYVVLRIGIGLMLASLSPGRCQISGPPENPEFFSAMSALSQQIPHEPPQPAPKGDVAELIWTHLIPDVTDPTKPPRVENRTTLRYNENHHEVERITNSGQGGESRTESVYRDGLLQSETTVFAPVQAKPPSPAVGNRWSYDNRKQIPIPSRPVTTINRFPADSSSATMTRRTPGSKASTGRTASWTSVISRCSTAMGSSARCACFAPQARRDRKPSCSQVLWRAVPWHA